MQPQTSWLNSPSCTHTTSSDIPVNATSYFWESLWSDSWAGRNVGVPSGSLPPGLPCFSVFWCVSPTVPPMVGGTLVKVSVWMFLCFRLETDLRQAYQSRKVSLVLGYIKPKGRQSCAFSLDPTATSPFPQPGDQDLARGQDHGKKLFLPSVSFLFQQNALCLPS